MPPVLLAREGTEGLGGEVTVLSGESCMVDFYISNSIEIKYTARCWFWPTAIAMEFAVGNTYFGMP